MNENMMGYEVKYVVSGFTGIATSKVEFMTGNIQYSVQPKSKDLDSIPNAYDIDSVSLEIVSEGISDKVIKPVESNYLGKRVKDKVTGVNGIAVLKLTYLDGCVSYALQSTVTKDNKADEPSWVNALRLEVIEEDKVNVPVSKTGGATVRSTFKQV